MLIAQMTVGGLAIGFVYALVGLGVVLLWNAAKTVNFAQGEFLMVGAYVSAFALGVANWTFGLSAVAVVVVGGGLGLLLYAFVYRPLRYADMMSVVVGTVGLSILLKNLGIIVFGPAPRVVPGLFDAAVLRVGDVRLMTQHLGMIGIGALLLVVQYVVMYRTRWGIAMRAIADDRDVAKVMGVPVERVTALVFAYATALAGLAGTLSAPVFFASIEMGSLFLTKAFVACVLGGFGSIPGVVLGGLALGWIEVFGAACISSTYKDVFAFLVLIVVLCIRPQGFLGERVPIKW